MWAFVRFIFCIIYYIGSIPNTICQLTNLQNVFILYGGNNGVTCSPLCLFSISSNLTLVPSTVCVYPQDNALCGLIAATNIHSLPGYSQWSCSTAGYTSTNPCTWPGLTCNGMNAVSINLNNIGLSGMIYVH